MQCNGESNWNIYLNISNSIIFLSIYLLYVSGGSSSKESALNAGHLSSIPRLGRSPGGEHGNPLQYCCSGLSWIRQDRNSLTGQTRGLHVGDFMSSLVSRHLPSSFTILYPIPSTSSAISHLWFFVYILLSTQLDLPDSQSQSLLEIPCLFQNHSMMLPRLIHQWIALLLG